MIKKIQKLKGFPIFYCDKKGNVFKNISLDKKKVRLKKLTVHGQEGKSAFVKLCFECNDMSLTLGKAILLAFDPEGYNPPKIKMVKGKKVKIETIAIFKDGDAENVHLRNLKWGTRKTQAEIAMKNPVNFKRVQKMGKKFGNRNGGNLAEWKRKNVDYPMKTKRKVFKLHKSGIRNYKIAERLGIPKGSVHGIIKRMKIKA